MKWWATRERPKIERIACPWLNDPFIDPEPEFLYVPAGEVLRVAISQGLSLNFTGDHAMLKQGMVVYDAFYAWCRGAPLAEAAHFPPMP